MDILDFRNLVAEALQKVEGLDKVFPLGNVVYVQTGQKEYEVVIRTVRSETREDLRRDSDHTVP